MFKDGSATETSEEAMKKSPGSLDGTKDALSLPSLHSLYLPLALTVKRMGKA